QGRGGSEDRDPVRGRRRARSARGVDRATGEVKSETLGSRNPSWPGLGQLGFFIIDCNYNTYVKKIPAGPLRALHREMASLGTSPLPDPAALRTMFLVNRRDQMLNVKGAPCFAHVASALA